MYGDSGGARIGQGECIRLLEKKGDWMTAKEISEELEQGITLVCRSLKKLHDNKEVLRTNIMKGRLTKYQWRAK